MNTDFGTDVLFKELFKYSTFFSNTALHHLTKNKSNGGKNESRLIPSFSIPVPEILSRCIYILDRKVNNGNSFYNCLYLEINP